MSADRPIRVALNGFGRIGRTILRILLRDAPDIELVLINEIEPLSTCAYSAAPGGHWPHGASTRPSP